MNRDREREKMEGMRGWHGMGKKGWDDYGCWIFLHRKGRRRKRAVG